jgi:hypothetical protein
MLLAEVDGCPGNKGRAWWTAASLFKFPRVPLLTAMESERQDAKGREDSEATNLTVRSSALWP